jgi:hypothetical protein
MARDDRILPETRWLAAFIIPFLVAAFVLLYVWPNDTGRLFAWTIKPAMTAMMLAAAYAGGIYFFTRAVLARHWHLIKLGFLPVTAFASLLGVATILHWDRFNHSHVSFFAWTALYFTTPFLVVAVWLRNRRTDPAVAESSEVVIPQLMRLLIGLVGVGTLAVSLLLFLRPDLMIRVWPWMLTPLTARVVGAMFALPAVVGVGIALERRWSAARIILEAQAFSIALILIATVRAWNNFDQSRPITWAFIAGLGLLLIALALSYTGIEMQRRKE